MPIYATNQDANNGGGGVTFEDVAEEVLNGILCHYEPPTSAAAQRKAVDLVVSGSFSSAAETKQRQGRQRANGGPPPPPPELLRRQSKSILKPSRLTRGASDINQTRSVTWRDHKNANNVPKDMDEMEQRMASCASSNCDFLQESTAEDQEMLNEIRIQQQQQRQPMDHIEAFRERKSPKTSSMKSKQQSVGKKTKDAPKKMLYDDEGNPISDDEDEEDDIIFRNDENAEPTRETYGMSSGPEAAIPPRPATKTSLLLGSLYGLANVCGLNVGGANIPPGSMSAIPTPTNGSGKNSFHQQPGEGKPPSSQSLPYRRTRSPPAPSSKNNNAESEDESEAIFDDVETPKKHQRGRLPQKSRKMREYDDTDDDENESPNGKKGRMQRNNRRPQTPHRSDESWDEDVDREMRRRSSPGGRGRGRPSRRPSSTYSDDDGYDDDDNSSNESGFEVDEYYRRGRNPSKSRSPGRRRSRSAGGRQSRELEFQNGELSLGGPKKVPKPKSKEGEASRSRRGRDVDEYETDDESLRDSPAPKSGRPRFGKASKSRKPMKVKTTRTPRGAQDDDAKQKPVINSPRAAYEAAISPKATPSKGKGKGSPSKGARKWRLGSKGAWKHADDISLTSLQNMVSKKKQNANSVTRATPIASNQTRATMARREEGVAASNGTTPEAMTSISEAVAARAARIDTGRTSPDPIDTDSPALGKSAGIRDPTPRRNVSNASSSGNNTNGSSLRNTRQPLPPTPRRADKTPPSTETSRKKESERSVPKKNNGMSRHIDIRENEDDDEVRDSGVSTQRSTNTKSRSSSPTSTATMNTEAEVREEVSSVGMESSTLRPHAENPFESIPDESVLRSKDQHAGHSKPPCGESRSKKSARQIADMEGDVASEESSKGSERSSSKKKGLFSGWRKKKGKVKAIAKEIEKDELPGPMPRVGISVE